MATYLSKVVLELLGARREVVSLSRPEGLRDDRLYLLSMANDPDCFGRRPKESSRIAMDLTFESHDQAERYPRSEDAGNNARRIFIRKYTTLKVSRGTMCSHHEQCFNIRSKQNNSIDDAIFKSLSKVLTISRVILIINLRC